MICFDEFHVSDIADAMILGRFLEQAMERGVEFVMTSNYPPDGLYPNGLQRERFLPAIELIKRRLDVVGVDNGTDYRRLKMERMKVYHVGSDAPLAKIFDVCMRARPAGLSFEAANPRHAHEWEDLRGRKIPDDKILIPGVIDTGLFLGMANVTLVGDDTDFRLIEERQRAVRA